MGKKKPDKAMSCQNCEFETEDVKLRGDKPLCHVCAESMPGLYVVGASGDQSLPALLMRQNAFCTNLILDEIRKLRGDGRLSPSPRKAARRGSLSSKGPR